MRLLWLVGLLAMDVQAATLVVSIGVEQYDDERISALRYAVADARAVAAAFRAAGVPPRNVTLLASDERDAARRPTRIAVLRALERLREQARPDDQVVLFFAGHGVQEGEQQFLLTVDTSRSLVADTALPLRLVAKALEGVQAKEVLFILDVCRNDPTAGRADADATLSDGLARGLRPAVATTGGAAPTMATLLACDIGQRAWEDPDAGHGVFTVSLLRALAGGGAGPDGWVRLKGLTQFVQSEVAAWAQRAGKQQAPKLVNPDDSDMVVVIPPPEPVVSVALTDQPLAAVVTLLAEQYGAQIVLGKGSDGGARVTGKLDNQPLSAVLRVLVAAHDLQVRRDQKVYIIEAKGATPEPVTPPADQAVEPGFDGPVITVAQDGSGQYKSVAEAVAAAPEGATVRIASGTYRSGLVIQKAISIVGVDGRDKVVIESVGGSSLQVVSGEARLRGVTLRMLAPEQNPADAGWVYTGNVSVQSAAKAQLEDCRLVTNWAVYQNLVTAGGRVSLRNSLTEGAAAVGCTASLGGTVDLENSLAQGTQTGAQAWGDGRLTARRCRLVGPRSGLLLYCYAPAGPGSGAAELDDCRLESGATCVQLQDRSTARLTACQMVQDGGQESLTSAAVVVIEQSTLTLRNCDVNRLPTAKYKAVALASESRATLVDCRLTGGDRCVGVDSGASVDIDNCDLTKATQYALQVGLHAGKVTVRNSRLRQNGKHALYVHTWAAFRRDPNSGAWVTGPAMKALPAMPYAAEITLTGCDLRGNAWGAFDGPLCWNVRLSGNTYDPEDLTVPTGESFDPPKETDFTGPTLTVAQDGTGQYQTIAAATNAAPAGARIQIGPGTYRESLYLTRPVALIGSTGQSIIEPADPKSAPLPIDAPTAWIQGLTLRAPGGIAEGRLVGIGRSRAAFRDCRFLGGQVDVYALGQAWFSGCYFGKAPRWAVQATGGAVARLTDCVVEDAGGPSLMAHTGGILDLSRVSVRNGRGFGVSVDGGASLRMLDCLIENNTPGALLCCGGHGLVILLGCRLRNNVHAVETTDTTYVRRDPVSGKWQGIWETSETNWTAPAPTVPPVVRDCDLRGNTEGAFNLAPGRALDLSNNLYDEQDATVPEDQVPVAPTEADFTGPTITVAQDGTGQYQTIGEAIAAAPAGAKIVVGPGTYREKLHLAKPLALFGRSGAAVTVIETPDRDSALFVTAPALVSGLTVRTADPAPDGTRYFNALNIGRGGRGLFQECSVTSPGGVGAWLDLGAQGWFRGCAFGNTRSVALWVFGSSSAEVRDCRFTSTGREDPSVIVHSGSQALLQGVVFQDQRCNPVAVDSGGSLRLSGSELAGQAGGAVVCHGAHGTVEIVDCRLFGSNGAPAVRTSLWTEHRRDPVTGGWVNLSPNPPDGGLPPLLPPLLRNCDLRGNPAGAFSLAPGRPVTIENCQFDPTDATVPR